MSADDSVVFHNVSFRFDSASEALFDDLSVHFSRGFTGVVGANGSGKTTLLRLATRELDPSQGSVQAPSDALYCPQRTDDPPVDLARLLEASDSEAHALPRAARDRRELPFALDFSQSWRAQASSDRGSALARPRAARHRRAYKPHRRIGAGASGAGARSVRRGGAPGEPRPRATRRALFAMPVDRTAHGNADSRRVRCIVGAAGVRPRQRPTST